MESNNNTTPATRYSTIGASPAPPRHLQHPVDEYDIHSLAGVPSVNFNNYWRKREELIEEYNNEVRKLKDFVEVKSLELYWQFYYKHLQLSAQRDFNTEVSRWMEQMEDREPEKKETATQTMPTLTLVIRPPEQEPPKLITVRPRFHPIRPRPVATGTNSSQLQPSTSCGKKYTFHPYQPPQQHQPEQPQPSSSTHQQEKEERRARKKLWKKNYPSYSYPSDSSPGSDTEPLDD